METKEDQKQPPPQHVHEPPAQYGQPPPPQYYQPPPQYSAVPPQPGLQQIPPGAGYSAVPPQPGLQQIPPGAGHSVVPPQPGLQQMTPGAGYITAPPAAVPQPPNYQGAPQWAMPQNQPGYGYNQPGQIQYPQIQQSYPQPGPIVQNTTIVASQAAAPTVIIAQQIRPPSYMWLSCVTLWIFGNPLFAAIAFGLSIGSESATGEGNLDQARQLGRAALWVNVSGIIVACIMYIIVLVIIIQ